MDCEIIANLHSKILGKHIRRMRIVKNLTLEQLAELTNLDDKHLGNIERGEVNPNTFTLFKIELALDYDLSAYKKELKEELKQLQEKKDNH